MPRREFINDLRRAYSSTEPVSVETDSALVDPAALARTIQKADLWLTPKILENFRVEDFEDLSTEARSKLQDAVSAFQAAASVVPQTAPATKEQAQEAYSRLLQILALVQPALREEWLKDVALLEQETESWCRKQGWPTESRSKRLSETWLGDYVAPKLHFFAFDRPFVLEPVGRFAPGATGLFDLAVIPTYDSAMVSRTAEKWYVHPVGEGARRPWSEGTFVDTLKRLASQP
jgi:hypothetical protein